MRLLIVEDSDQVRRMLGNLVGDLAEEIGECRDGAEALAAYAEFLPDWVLMDIKMTNLDGLAATRQIMAAEPEAKVMIVTGYDNPALRLAAAQAGARCYVVKDDLLAIRQILSPDQTP